MKAKLNPLAAAMICLTSLAGCVEDKIYHMDSPPEMKHWIEDVMREHYVWCDRMPSLGKESYLLAPDAFLELVRAPDDRGLSRIETPAPVGKASYGFELYPCTLGGARYAVVTYVASDCPAADAGVERGDWIMEIDGEPLTDEIFASLSAGGALTLTVGRYLVGQDGVGSVVPVGERMLAAARAIRDEPVRKTQIFWMTGTDKVVGYLFYNRFEAGPTAGDETFDDALREFSTDCLQKGVNEFVLDLRRNAGGDPNCARLLCTLLAPRSRMNGPLASVRYNEKQAERNVDYALDPACLGTGSNLDLKRVYILTGPKTGGAAEMVVNWLRPFMEVVLIGSATKGENAVMRTFSDERFGSQLTIPVAEAFNAAGDSHVAGGFEPRYEVLETGEWQGVLPFGNPDETLLDVALNLIAGNDPVAACR